MSNRLHVGATEAKCYDLVITDDDISKERLLNDWLCAKPWKVSIANIALWRRIEHLIKEAIECAGGEYPDDVWYFYYQDQAICHPTQTELEEFLNAIKEETWRE